MPEYTSALLVKGKNQICADTVLRKRTNQLNNFLIRCAYENENATAFGISKLSIVRSQEINAQ